MKSDTIIKLSVYLGSAAILGAALFVSYARPSGASHGQNQDYSIKSVYKSDNYELIEVTNNPSGMIHLILRPTMVSGHFLKLEEWSIATANKRGRRP